MYVHKSARDLPSGPRDGQPVDDHPKWWLSCEVDPGAAASARRHATTVPRGTSYNLLGDPRDAKSRLFLSILCTYDTYTYMSFVLLSRSTVSVLRVCRVCDRRAELMLSIGRATGHAAPGAGHGTHTGSAHTSSVLHLQSCQHAVSPSKCACSGMRRAPAEGSDRPSTRCACERRAAAGCCRPAEAVIR